MFGRTVNGIWATAQFADYPQLLNAKLAACVAALVQTRIDEKVGAQQHTAPIV
jgi:hypothetical protein